MKPIKITMQAFGPYVEKNIVDFTALGENSLFLITGPTGSGKTTILDAMSFALYGSATGTLREWRYMRSIAAPKDTPTEVEFTFSLFDKTYRFTRTRVVHTVNKRNGTKEEQYNDSASCDEFKDGAWVSIAVGPPAVARTAEELLHFNHDQFSQVIVLPQGDFRRLLVANSSEKQKILEVMFDCGRWLNIAKTAERREKDLFSELKDAENSSAALLHSVNAEDTDALRGMLEEVGKRAEDETARLKALDSECAALSEEQSAAEKLCRSYDELAECTGRRKRLLSRTEEMENNRREIEWLESARILQPYYDGALAAKRTADAKQKAAEEAAAKLSKSETAVKAARAAIPEEERLRSLAAEKNEYLQELKHYEGDARRLAEVQRELEAASGDLKAAKERKTAAEQEADRLTERIKNGEAMIDEIFKNHVALLPDLNARKLQIDEKIKTVNSYLSAADAQKKAELELKKASDEKQNADRQLEAAKAVHERITACLRADSAYELSLLLREGEACPVCGSIHHPSPATAAKSDVNGDTATAAEKAVKLAQSESEQAAGNFAAAKARAEEAAAKCGELREQCGGAELELRQLEESRRKNDAELELCRQKSLELNSLRELAEKLKAEHNDKAKHLTALTEELTRISEREIKLRTNFTELQSRVPQGCTVEELERKIAETAALSADSSKRADELSAARQKSEVEYSACSAQLESANMASDEALQTARKKKREFLDIFESMELPEGYNVNIYVKKVGQLAGLRATLSDWEKELGICGERIAVLQKETGDTPRPDLDEINDRLALRRQAQGECAKSVGSLGQRLKQLEETAARLEELEQRCANKRQEYAVTAKLARLLSGGNALKTPIQNFVLGIMLDEIVAAANVHFDALSRGQYSLVRVEPDGGGRGYRGLELYVVDAHRGGRRGVATLSGGELFLASLSLAFGLSETVQGYAGGVRLDSIFIDEGFGTLDDETLDCAMKALAQIRESGRMVGIISHVSELKGRIPAKIEVSKNELGESRASVVC